MYTICGANLHHLLYVDVCPGMNNNNNTPCSKHVVVPILKIYAIENHLKKWFSAALRQAYKTGIRLCLAIFTLLQKIISEQGPV